MFLLLVPAAMLAAEASAARMSLLDLIGVGSRSGSRVRRSAADTHKRVRVDHAEPAQPAAANAAATAAVTNAAVSAAAAAVLASTNGVEIVADDGETAPSAATNGVDAATSPVAAVGTNGVDDVAQERARPPAHISAKKVYYDRKDGYAVFTGRVFVDGEDYQMHANKAYVFFEGTNELKRVVAMGGVAITNDTKRAYGSKASYYRQTGMVVLYGDDNAPAEVRNESKGDDQVVKGSKIKFWIDSEQVEVVDARISAPVTGGLEDLKSNGDGRPDARKK